MKTPPRPDLGHLRELLAYHRDVVTSLQTTLELLTYPPPATPPAFPARPRGRPRKTAPPPSPKRVKTRVRELVKRTRTARFLEQFSEDEAKPAKRGGQRGLGMLVQHGYLTVASHDPATYQRTAKPYLIQRPSHHTGNTNHPLDQPLDQNTGIEYTAVSE